MFQDTDLAAMAEALSRSPDYRILRRLVARPTYMPTVGQEVRTGILLDTETTGLDHSKDEIIELGMVAFDYTADAKVYSNSVQPKFPFGRIISDRLRTLVRFANPGGDPWALM